MRFLILPAFLMNAFLVQAQPIIVYGQPGRLEIRTAGTHSIRITLKPAGYKYDFPYTPAVDEHNYPAAIISVDSMDGPVKRRAGNLWVEIKPNPLSIIVTNNQGQFVQQITFSDSGNLSFALNTGPVLGMGEGGPKPSGETDWRNLPVQFDRSGTYDSMQPRWQADAYGSRNPAAMLMQPAQWGLFVATPWVAIDLRDKEHGFFVPYQPAGREAVPQTEKNQGLNLGKGLPPIDKIVPGLYDFFVFDAHKPTEMMKDFSVITGPAALPPKWALGYMQSHRTLQDDTQMMGIIDSFRAKRIPLDAVIYLGTGFTPSGWNKRQPSFEFNPEVFKHDPKEVLSEMHKRHVKVIVHVVPWDRDKLPTLHGNIPARRDEILDASHIQTYWQQHLPLIQAGVDAFWPDEGDWFNLFERIERHQLYYQGLLSSHPNIRPWSLQRNGYPGIAKWGGWVWSGDTESSWKTLEAQIAVGINYSLSIAPFWGSDIGGFYSSPEKTAELYIRWFQFGAFTPCFRSHGRTWMTSLPWGFGLNDMGPVEMGNEKGVLQSEMNNPSEEPITRKYTELRYQLLPYNYTLAWEARNSGMPMMRALWLHYPNDAHCRKIGDEYLWGRELLIAPVYEKGAEKRSLYLPEGEWYDWWTNTKLAGGRTITRAVDISILPVYVRAGSIIPFDTIRQYTGETVRTPTELKIFTGIDGQFTLYDDDGISQDYLKGKGNWISISWNEKARQITIRDKTPKKANNDIHSRKFRIRLIPGNETRSITYTGQPLVIKF